MKRIRGAITIALVFALAGIFTAARAQYQRPYRVTEREVERLLTRIETRTDRFKDALSRALDRSRFDETRREDNINLLVSDFEQATDQMRDRFDRRVLIESDVRMVLDRAAEIDNFMTRVQLANNAESSWMRLREDLDQLANYYNIAWNWRGTPPIYGGQGELTGTYRLNVSQSDNPRTVLQRAVRGLPYNERQRALNQWLPRIEAPQMLAIERRGLDVTIASSRFPQVSFEADGRERSDRSRRDGRLSRTRATLSGDQLTITSTGDRRTDFTVIIDPMDNGRRLRVTRHLYIERLAQPITINSIYDRISTVAQWNVYTGAPVGGRVRDDYIVPDDTVLVTRLNNDLDTERTREGDRFTLTVISPSRYDGAIIEGYVSAVDRGGRITGRSEMALNLERIRMRNGQTYAFEGIIENIRPVNGQDVRVDTEGVVEPEESQSERTIERTAIGAAIGAVIGAIVEGVSGAAIGAAVGAGAGAGSVYIQGREDLELMSGTEITIRANSPRLDVLR
ncbi:MAG TPA: YMGG-like glycine zipper-containing protein [Blastocatellia bacterium]|nr:YMGG-like glycine zipper-containing protein [Blastocatellia bacterium]